jgi:GMP reductase
MSTIVDEDTCVYLAENNIFYVMHRFDVDAVEFTQRMRERGLLASVSFGIKPVDFDVLARFVAEGVAPDFITVDVAHGDSEAVFRIVRAIRTALPDTYVIAGNVASVEGALRLAEAGAHAVKAGVGPGLSCITAPNTGFGSKGWQLSAVWRVATALKNSDYSNVQVVADGGIRHYGDIAKSIAFGADMVMIGSMFAGHDENPGEVVEIDGEMKKAFFGSASEHQKGEHKHVEGQKLYVPYKGSLSNTLRIIRENLQSSVSYAGGDTLEALHDVEYVRVTR